MKDHSYVDMEYVRNNPNKLWNKYYLSFNKGLTVKDIETLILPNSTKDWDWYVISDNINIQEVRNNPNKPWNKLWLCCNKQLTVKDIETFRLFDHNSYWNLISENINVQEIIDNPHKPWNREGLEDNIVITDKILEFFDAGLLKHLQRNIPQFKYHTDIVVKCEY